MASDVVKVKSEDPTTPGCCKGRQGEVLRWQFSIVRSFLPLGSLVRNPSVRNDSAVSAY